MLTLDNTYQLRSTATRRQLTSRFPTARASRNIRIYTYIRKSIFYHDKTWIVENMYQSRDVLNINRFFLVWYFWEYCHFWKYAPFTWCSQAANCSHMNILTICTHICIYIYILRICWLLRICTSHDRRDQAAKWRENALSWHVTVYLCMFVYTYKYIYTYLYLYVYVWKFGHFWEYVPVTIDGI